MKDNRSKVLVNAYNGHRSSDADHNLEINLLTNSVEPTVPSTSRYAFVNAMKQHDASCKRGSGSSAVNGGPMHSNRHYFHIDGGYENGDGLRNTVFLKVCTNSSYIEFSE